MLIATAGVGSAVFGRSRYCTAATDVRGDDEVLCRALRDWVTREVGEHRAVVVLPLSDRLLDVLDTHRDSFEARYRLAIPPSNVASALLDKSSAFQLAAEAGLDVPRWVTVRGGDDVKAADALELPVVVRPTSWRTVGEEYFKFAVAQSRPELHSMLNAALGRGATLLVQEYLEVDDHDVEFAILWRSADAAVTATCTGRKLRQSGRGGGVMAWGEAVDLSDVREQARRFLKTSGFSGLGGIEFIRHDTRLWFIEFNPRLEAIHFLATAAGLDTVALAYDELAHGELPGRLTPQRDAAAWIGSAWLERVGRERDQWWVMAGDRLRFALRPRRTKAVWSLGDPMPGLALLARLAGRGMARLGSQKAAA